jgi:hypothetical protein
MNSTRAHAVPQNAAVPRTLPPPAPRPIASICIEYHRRKARFYGPFSHFPSARNEVKTGVLPTGIVIVLVVDCPLQVVPEMSSVPELVCDTGVTIRDRAVASTVFLTNVSGVPVVGVAATEIALAGGRRARADGSRDGVTESREAIHDCMRERLEERATSPGARRGTSYHKVGAGAKE